MKIIILAITFLMLISPLQAHTVKQERPNIIIIMADDLGYGDLGSYKGIQKTPNLDQLAKEGMRFTDFHSSGTVCSPTRAGFITGRYQHKSGVDGVVNADPEHPSYSFGVDPQSEITFPNLVKAQGYKTALMGKWHIGYEKRFNPMNFGFDRFVGFLSGNIDYISHYDRMENFDWWHDRQQVEEEGYTTQLITKHATDFINTNKKNPFLLYIAHEAVHNPMQGPTSPILRGPNKQKKNKDIVGSEVYKEVIAELDISVGKIIQTVKRAGISDNTLIIFTSDNGPMPLSSAGVLRGIKGSLYEGGHRVPTIAWWPNKIKSHSINNQLTSSLDVMPTILSLTGASVPKGHKLDGIDLMPTLLGQAETHRELFWRNGGLTLNATNLLTKDKSKAMRSGKWKLVVSPYYKEASLYDLSVDVAEQYDIAHKHPKIVKAMMAKVRAWEDDVIPYLPYKVVPENEL